jgi:magnesium chelatase accessory protein
MRVAHADAAMRWAVDGPTWPLHDHSRFVEAAGQCWHVQKLAGPGRGAPRVLLLHGTGASTHSWRLLMPLLAPSAEVLALDLPGHGFSPPLLGGKLTLPRLAGWLATLLRALHWQPDLAVGHSAGAAILAQLVLDGGLPVQGLVSLNGAFLPFGGVAAPIFSPMARLLHALPGVPQLFASRATDLDVVRRLVEGTGSHLDADGLLLYQRLIRDPTHARAALGMMAHWDLRPLARSLPQLPCPLHLIVGQNDRAVAPSQARSVARRVPRSTLTLLPGLGHLAHEEAPARVAPLILQRLAEPVLA